MHSVSYVTNLADMNVYPVIHIWDGCNPGIAEAIELFAERWGPYTLSSKRYPLIRLVEDLIDPAVDAYWEEISTEFKHGPMPGCGTEASLSEVAVALGFDNLVLALRSALRRIMKQQEIGGVVNQEVIATSETLVDLSYGCAAKHSSISRPGEERLNLRRRKSFCRYCGAFSELAEYAEAVGLPVEDAASRRLSSRYCRRHKARLPGGAWNIEYKRVRRNQKQFDLELARLMRQSSSPASPVADSGNVMVDHYVHSLVVSNAYQPSDRQVLRDLARCMVDERLTDQKKEIVVLLSMGFTQSDISKELGITRQTAHKLVASLKSVSSVFRLDGS